jgi:hypothetical protein
MRQTELRRFLIRLAAVASPIPFTAVACGGNVMDRSAEGAAGASAAGNVGTGGGAGGYPVFQGAAPSGGVFGGTGGYPVFMGGGGPSAGGAYPVFMGSVDAGVSAGGSQIFVGRCGTYDVRVTNASDAASDCRLCSSNQGAGPFPSPCEKITVDGLPYVRCTPNCIGGRRPQGLAASAPSTSRDVCAYFEEMSRLEAASVPAFRVLARELRVHGAPRALRRAARRAAGDEIRHARMGRVLAERFGGTYQRPQITPRPLRSVEELALDNATEGCVRETFGAMIATWQARAATDPVVRRIMRRVAVDETRHAALALRVAEWAERRLDVEAQQRVRNARRAAARTVLRELEREPSAELVSVAGVPRRFEAQALARALEDRLWA